MKKVRKTKSNGKELKSLYEGVEKRWNVITLIISLFRTKALSALSACPTRKRASNSVMSKSKWHRSSTKKLKLPSLPSYYKKASRKSQEPEYTPSTTTLPTQIF